MPDERMTPECSTPDYSELVKALRALNSPYKKVGVLREFHNTAADAIERLSVRSESGSSVAPEPVAWRTRRTDALGEPFGPWLYVTSEPTHDPEAPVEPLFTVALSATGTCCPVAMHGYDRCRFYSEAEERGDIRRVPDRNIDG